uniref:SCP domain-containing protein n=1 Tax=Parastrongyloides trichosuri TaxID=131310 RepID=A0A0N4ZEH6_PARTI
MLNYYKNRLKFLRNTNGYRYCHTTARVKTNKTLEKHAQEWASHLAKINKMKHSGKKGVGENILKISNNLFYKKGIHKWYEEKKKYNFSHTAVNKVAIVGHFTQLVWKKSKTIGFGFGKNGSMIFVVCLYYPRGNIRGQYEKNVLPKKKYRKICKI